MHVQVGFPHHVHQLVAGIVVVPELLLLLLLLAARAVSFSVHDLIGTSEQFRRVQKRRIRLGLHAKTGELEISCFPFSKNL